MSREERRLPALLALPGRRAVGADAAERRAPVAAFLDANCNRLSHGHGRYLVQRLALLQHLDERLDAARTGLWLFRGLQAPENCVPVRRTQRLEEIRRGA